METNQKQNDFKKVAEYQDYLMEHPRLTNLFLELTDQCNLSCKHCGSKCSSKNSTFLDTAAVIKVLNRISSVYDPNYIRICITGGEPILHT